MQLFWQMEGSRVSSGHQYTVGKGNTRIAACHVLSAFGKWKRCPFWGTRPTGLGHGQPLCSLGPGPMAQPGGHRLDASVPTLIHGTLDMGPKYEVTTCNTRSRVYLPRQHPSRASTARPFPQCQHFLSLPLGPLITMTTPSHSDQPGCFLRGGLVSLLLGKSPSGALIFILGAGQGVLGSF